MFLGHESYRVRWIVLVCVWSLAATAALMQAGVIGDYLQLTGRLGLRGAPQPETPLIQTYPAFAIDGEVWVRHALALLEGDDIRLRFTTVDNAPYGREVHWNSAWAWTIAGAGWVQHLFTGQPLEHSVERATIWLNPVVHVLLMILISSWATRKGGLMVGLFVVGAVMSNDRIYEGFFPAYVDHHGLLTLAVFGMVLGAVFMGGGWWKPADEHAPRLLPHSAEAARLAAVFSAISGAAGLWVSAASVIPPIAIVGISAVLATLLYGRTTQAQGAVFDGEAWRLWGRVGAVSSMAFYLLEYFPQHLSFRLEPNHPLHALAWLGAGEMIAQFGERWLGPKNRFWSNLGKLAWPLAAIAAVPLVVLIGGVRVFSVLDPFMSHLHNDYIQEFLPIWRTFQGFTGTAIFQTAVLGSLPLIVAIATLSYRRSASPLVLVYATICAILFLLMAVWQSRWLLNATGAQISLGIVVLAVFAVEWRLWIRWVVVMGVIGALMVPTMIYRYTSARSQVRTKQVSPGEAKCALSRDIAAVLRASQPEGEIIMLASPNASSGIGYYGRFKTLGTLYWENTAGLKAAANIFAAHTEDEAAALIKKHKVTHIALVAEENFIEQYYRLLHPKATDDEVRRCFGLRLLADRVVPQWLQMIPYKTPDDLALLKPIVMLFKVNFGQTMPEALYNAALTQIANGEVNQGERALDKVLQLAPNAPEPWLRKGELLLARRAWVESVEFTLRGIALSKAESRPAMYAEAAANLYSKGIHGLAAQVYRAGLADKPTGELATYLSWILATSPEDSVRNGKEALEFANQAVKADPNSPSSLSALSAALAENGRFPEAIAAADRAVANSALRNDDRVLQQEFARRLAVVRAGQPLRQPAPAPATTGK